MHADLTAFDAALASSPGRFDPEKVEHIRDLLFAGLSGPDAVKRCEHYAPCPYNYVEFDAFANRPPPVFLINGAMVEGTVHAFYGQSGAGKTFAALDLAMCVATGTPWFNRETNKAAVLWVAAEDPDGVMLRARAWGLRHGVRPSNFVVMEGNLFNLRRPETMDSVIQYGNRVLRRSGCSHLLVVIDTLVRATPGADEVSGKDTGEIVAAFDLIRYSLPSTVCVIHHSGKNEDAGLRGHSSLGQGIDSFARVSKSTAGSVITFEKVKNAKVPPPIGFNLEVVPVDLDADGGIRDSCVVVTRSLAPVEVGPLVLSSIARDCRADLATEIRDEGVTLPDALTGGVGVKGVPTGTWKAAFKSRRCADMKPGAFRVAWKRASNRLIEDGYVRTLDYDSAEYAIFVDTS